MKYYYDTEFLEGTQTIYSFWGMKADTWFRIIGGALGVIAVLTAWTFGAPTLSVSGIAWFILMFGVGFFWHLSMEKTPPTIDLISIGIVSEDNREYYAVSKDFNLKDAWNRYDVKNKEKVYWIRDNVLNPIFNGFLEKELGYPPTLENYSDYMHREELYFSYKNFKRLLRKYGTTNKVISMEVILFCSPLISRYSEFGMYKYGKPEFYGYYSAYDHVVFCWLFGKMLDLPKGFPMYTIDLKQELDRVAKMKNLNAKDTKSAIALLKSQSAWIFPVNEGEHNALEDARWNRDLHKFLKLQFIGAARY